MYYNSKRKLLYIEYLSNSGASTTGASALFKQTEETEREYDLDLCELPLDAIQNLLGASFGYTKQSKARYVSSLRKYVRWCGSMWFTTSSACDEIKIDMSKYMSKNMVSSPQHLARILDESFKPLEDKSVDCIYRCVFWMAFVGVPHDHLTELRAKDFDLPNRILRYKGSCYDLPVESIRAITDALYLRYFNVGVHAKHRRKNNRFAALPREKGSHMLRSVRQSES